MLKHNSTLKEESKPLCLNLLLEQCAVIGKEDDGKFSKTCYVNKGSKSSSNFIIFLMYINKTKKRVFTISVEAK